MFETLSPAERDTLAAKLQSAAGQFLAEYDALKANWPGNQAIYGLCPGGDCDCPDRCHVIPSSWLMCCVEAGQARRELVGRG